MATPALGFAVFLYIASAAAYLVAFVWPARGPVARAAHVLTWSGFAVQAAAIGLGCAETHGRHLLTVVGAAGLVGWLAAGAFLAAERTLRKPVLGALMLPLVIALIVPQALTPAPAASGPAALSGVPSLRLHVLTAAGGIAVLTLACAVGLMFLLQERELKGKRFGPLLSRLPPLQALDGANAVLLAVGFAVFSVAVASGAVAARSAWCAFWEWDGQQIAAAFVWAVFGAMVLARFAGARGRRQAAMTVAAFALVVATLVGVRQYGTTRHAALDAAPAMTCGGPT